MNDPLVLLGAGFFVLSLVCLLGIGLCGAARLADGAWADAIEARRDFEDAQVAALEEIWELSA